MRLLGTPDKTSLRQQISGTVTNLGTAAESQAALNLALAAAAVALAVWAR